MTDKQTQPESAELNAQLDAQPDAQLDVRLNAQPDAQSDVQQDAYLDARLDAASTRPQTNGAPPAELPEEPAAEAVIEAAAETVTETDTAKGIDVVQALETQLAEVQSKAAEYLDGWQRARAEFANYRKRAEKEREEIYQNAAAETLRKLLPVIDDFERAVANAPEDKRESDELIKGFTLIHRKLITLLESQGIKAIDPHGQPFDPAFHEALGQDDSANVPSGHISTVLQKGYVFGERVLRPALVRVAS